MYSPLIINKNISRIERKLNRELPRSSIELVDLRVKHFNSLINLDLWKEKKQIEFKSGVELTPEEREWIETEQFICTYDYGYFASRYAYIDCIETGLGHYAQNKAQLILNDVRAEMEEKYKAIFILILKARQEGMSTDLQISMLHRALFHVDSNILMASSKEDKTGELFSKSELVLEHLPWFLISNYSLTTTGVERFVCPQMRSKIRLQWGNIKGGVGRGETPRQGHLTEIPDWLFPKEDIQNSLMKAIHPTPETYLVVESTAKFKGDYWNELWDDAVTYYPQGLSLWNPMFLAWYVADDIYPTETWLRNFPIPEDWHPPEMVIAQALRAESEVARNPLYRKYMKGENGRPWKMPLRQMWYWFVDREMARREKRLGTWTAEVPSNAKEAFAVRGTSIFDNEKIYDLRAKAKPPIAAFEIMGKLSEIPPKLAVPTPTDKELPSIPIYADWGGYHSTFSLRPLRVGDFSTLDPDCKLIIWEMPDAEEKYHVIVDTGEGVGQDRTVINVFREGDMERRDEQCAEFSSAYVGGEDAFGYVMAICSFYAVPFRGQSLQPQLAIERAKGGEITIHRMRMSGYARQYIHVSLGKRDQDRTKATHLGWETNKATRAEAISSFLVAIRDDEILINSPWFLEEMQSFGRNERTRKLEALSGSHDDRLMTGAIASFTMHVMEILGMQESASSRRAEVMRKKLELEREGGYDYGAMARAVKVEESYYTEREDYY